MIRGLTCDYKVTVCAAKDLQQTKFMSRHDGVFDEKKDKAKSDVDPYVMIGNDLPSWFLQDHSLLWTLMDSQVLGFDKIHFTKDKTQIFR